MGQNLAIQMRYPVEGGWLVIIPCETGPTALDIRIHAKMHESDYARGQPAEMSSLLADVT